MRLWKLEKPHDGQVQSPGRGLFLLGGNGMRMLAALSRTRLELGETSMAFSFNARPFMHRLSAACFFFFQLERINKDIAHHSGSQGGNGPLGGVGDVGSSIETSGDLPPRGKKTRRSRCQWVWTAQGYAESRKRWDDHQIA